MLVDYTIRKFCVQSVRRNPCAPSAFEFFKQVVAKSHICLKEVRKISLVCLQIIKKGAVPGLAGWWALGDSRRVSAAN